MFAKLERFIIEYLNKRDNIIPNTPLATIPALEYDEKTNSLVLNSDYNIVINAPNIILKTSEDIIIIANKLHLNPPVSDIGDKNVKELIDEVNKGIKDKKDAKWCQQKK